MPDPIRQEAHFLVDRLAEFETDLRGGEAARHFFGHVAPSAARLRSALAQDSQAIDDDTIDQLAGGIEKDPKRAAETARHHHALLHAMNASHDGDYMQDGLCVIEGIARLLGNILGSLPDDALEGHLSYVTTRAARLALIAKLEGASATVLVQADDDGRVVEAFTPDHKPN